MPPTRRRTSSPDAKDLAGLREAPPAAGRLRKAPADDPVLGVASTPTTATSDRSEQVEQARQGRPAPGRRSSTSTSSRSATATSAGSTSAGSTSAGSTSAGKSKVGFYQSPDDSARARAAFAWTRTQEGHRSFSDFVAHALMREVERLEAEYHGGRAWPPMEPGQLPTGKPFGG